MSNPPFSIPSHNVSAEVNVDTLTTDNILTDNVELTESNFEDLRVGSASTESIPGVQAPGFSQLSSDGVTPIDQSSFYEASQFYSIPANLIFDLNYTPITGLGWTVAVWVKQLLRVSNQTIVHRTSGGGSFYIRINSNGRVRVDNGPSAISFKRSYNYSCQYPNMSYSHG